MTPRKVRRPATRNLQIHQGRLYSKGWQWAHPPSRTPEASAINHFHEARLAARRGCERNYFESLVGAIWCRNIELGYADAVMTGIRTPARMVLRAEWCLRVFSIGHAAEQRAQDAFMVAEVIDKHRDRAEAYASEWLAATEEYIESAR